MKRERKGKKIPTNRNGTKRSPKTVKINKKIQLYIPYQKRSVSNPSKNSHSQPKRLPLKNITSDLIDDRSITSEKLSYEIVSTEHIQPEAIESHHIKLGVICPSHLKPLSITAEQIADQTIHSQKIANQSITSDKLALAAIKGEHLQPESILGNHLHSGIIESDHLANSSISINKLAFTPIQAINQKNPVMQQFGIAPFKIKKDHSQADLLISFDDSFSSPDFVVVAMTNHPDCYVVVKSQKNQSVTLTILRRETTEKLSGLISWIAIGKK